MSDLMRKHDIGDQSIYSRRPYQRWVQEDYLSNSHAEWMQPALRFFRRSWSIFVAITATVLLVAWEIGVLAGESSDSADNPSGVLRASIIDTIAPTPNITSNDSAHEGWPFSLMITFSEPVTGFDLHDVLVRNGNVQNLEGTGANYIATLTPRTRGTMIVEIDAGAAKDYSGNQSAAAPRYDVIVDVAPSGSPLTRRVLWIFALVTTAVAVLSGIFFFSGDPKQDEDFFESERHDIIFLLVLALMLVVWIIIIVQVSIEYDLSPFEIVILVVCAVLTLLFILVYVAIMSPDEHGTFNIAVILVGSLLLGSIMLYFHNASGLPYDYLIPRAYEKGLYE